MGNGTTQDREQVEVEAGRIRIGIAADNVRRGRTLARTIIGIESVLAAVDITSAALRVDSRFHFSGYLLMYLALIAVNLAQLQVLKHAARQIGLAEPNGGPSAAIAVAQRCERLFSGYLTLLMTWSSVVTLMDQRLYGQTVVFMVTMITSSVLYELPPLLMLIPYVVSTAVLAIGLPFFSLPATFSSGMWSIWRRSSPSHGRPRGSCTAVGRISTGTRSSSSRRSVSSRTRTAGWRMRTAGSRTRIAGWRERTASLRKPICSWKEPIVSCRIRRCSMN